MLLGACLLVPATAQIPLNPLPQRALGHADLRQATSAVNLVDGRELNRPQGVALDSARRIVWVADTGNNRVLGWRNASAFDNGARADFVLGQRDLTSTDPQGPGTTFSGGTFAPTAVAVDTAGNVFVHDSGNNRVLRYPRPFDQPDQLPDQVIGQPDFRTRAANFAGVTEKSLFSATNNGILKAALAFDAQGNLWVVDPGNHRLLRFSANVIGDNAASFPSANMVLGQPDFATNIPLQPGPNQSLLQPETRSRKNGIREPSGIAFDQAGRLFVIDALNRVVVYRPPFAVGSDAVRIMGIGPAVPQGTLPPPPVNEFTIGIVNAAGAAISAEAVFCIGNVVFVVDTPASRLVRYDAFDAWVPEATQFSPPGRAAIGQDGLTLTQLRPNRGLPEPNNSSINQPTAGAFANGETFLVDSENNRVIVFGDISTGPPAAAGAPYNARRVLGQDNFAARSPNLLEGREFAFTAQGNLAGSGLVIDSRSNPPRLYVADTFNHRVLGFADARRVRSGDKADVVIGQPDFTRALLNFPSNDPNVRGPGGLAFPTGVAVDRDGNVWVADNGNSRVLRFPNPFGDGFAGQADLVIGQSNFSNRLQDATARTMSAPYGLAFSAEGSLFVSDSSLHRVMMFNPPNRVFT